jgi:hypothetical protein
VVAVVALVLATVTAFAVPLAIAMTRLLESRALDGLQGRVEQFALWLDVTRDCGELQLRVAQADTDAVEVTVVGSDRVVVATTAPTIPPRLAEEAVSDTATGRVGRHVGDGRLAVATLLTTTVCGRPLILHVAAPDAELQRSLVVAWSSILAVAAVVAVLAAGAGAQLARRLARPFEALTEAATRLGDGDFSVRAPRSGLEEADAIAVALDGTAERLGRAVERSAAFTADASHQLRTPLTALRLQLESLELTGADASGVAAALAEADRLEATIAELTALTRLDTPRSPSTSGPWWPRGWRRGRRWPWRRAVRSTDSSSRSPPSWSARRRSRRPSRCWWTTPCVTDGGRSPSGSRRHARTIPPGSCA